MSRKSESTAPSTRERVLAAARSLIEEQGFEVGMGEIARRAGISRQGAYLHFSSKGELLRQLTTWVEEQADLETLLRPVAEASTGEEALRALLDAAAVFEPQIHTLAVAVDRIGDRDPRVQAISADRMRRRLAGMREVVARIDAEGRLRAGWDVDRAAAFVWSTTAPSAYHLMVTQLGWSPEQWADETYRLLHDGLVVAE
jgi:AcrR family transcriptional regulator